MKRDDTTNIDKNDHDELDDLLTSQGNDPAFAAALHDAQHRSRLIDDLVACRKATKVSQAVVAERMGIGQSTVSEFESGTADFFVSTAQRYARAVTARVRFVLDMPCDGPWAGASATHYRRNEPRLVYRPTEPETRLEGWREAAGCP